MLMKFHDKSKFCMQNKGRRSFPWIMEDLLQFANIKHDNVFHQEKIKAETDLFVQLGL